MQENRSFDHYFGTMRGVRGFGDPHPVTLPSGKPVWYQADGHDERPAVPARRRQDLALSLPRGPRPQLGRHARGVERRQLRPVGAGQDHHLHGAPDARGHAVPLRAGRRVHGLRRLPLLDARPDQPQPLLHVDGLGRQRRQGRRPGRRQRRARLRLDDLPRAPAAGRHRLEDLPGQRHGLDAAGFWGWTVDPYIGNYGDNSLLYFHQYQNAAARRPAVRQGPDRAPNVSDTGAGRALLRHARAPTSEPASCRRSRGSSRPRRTPSTRTGRPTTAPGTSRRCSTR